MKINRLSFAVLAAAGLLALSIPAQAENTNAPAAPTTPAPGGAPGSRPARMSVDQRLSLYSEQLSLTDDQKTKVKAILEDQAKQMTGISRDEEGRAKMQALREDMSKKMKDILTPEQFDKFSQMRGPGGRRGGAGGASTNAPAAKP